MKTNSISTAIVLTSILAASTAFAQPANPAVPSTPAPEVQVNLTPNQVIYLPQLPSATALANAAAAQGISVAQINQTNAQITVVYKYSNGQTNTICYQLLSAAMAAPVPAGTTAVAVPGQNTVIYERSAPGYYYNSYYDPYYYPWPWFAPVAVSVGFGFHGGYHGGYYGGYRGGWGNHGGGHGRR